MYSSTGPMFVHTALPQPPSEMKRSGSINVFRGRTGSLRRKEAPHKRSLSSQLLPSAASNNPSAGQDSGWKNRGPSTEQPPVIAYTVAISGGEASDKRPRERRRMFERILHKKAPSYDLLPIEEADGYKTPKRSITPALFREDPREEARRASRGHSRSTSAMSFFHPETAQPVPEDDEDPAPMAAFSTTHERPGTSEDSLSKKPTAAPRHNTAGSVQRKPVSARRLSDENVSPRTRPEERKPERPMLTVQTQTTQPVSRSHSEALKLAHPPRKSSLPGTEAPTIDAPVDSQADTAVSTKDALTNSFEVSAQHRRQRSKDLVQPVLGFLDPTGPTPPPKDGDKGYHMQQIQLEIQKGLDVTIPDRSPLKLHEIFGEANARSTKTSNLKSARSGNGLPSPRLSSPRQSTLAQRRTGVPGSMTLVARSRKKNVHGVLGSMIPPIMTPNRISKSRESSRRSSRNASPAIGKAVTTNSAKVLAAMPQAPVRRPPPPPLQLKIPLPQIQTQPQQPRSLALQPQPDRSKSDTIIRAPVLPEGEKRPTPPAKSPHRLHAMKRRSLSEGHVSIIAQRAPRKKSVHKRKPTGFRLNKDAQAAFRGRQAERPTIPAQAERSSLAHGAGERRDSSPLTSLNDGLRGKRRSQSPKPNGRGLTPPQRQGEWHERGRRNPSPLRSGESAGREDSERRPELGSRTRSGDSDSSAAQGRSTPDTGARGQPHAAESATSAARRARTEAKQAQILGTELKSLTSAVPGKVPEQKEHQRSNAAGRAINPLASHPMKGGREAPGASPELQTTVPKVTAEESIKRMIAAQEQQAVAMRMKLLGLRGAVGA